LISDLLTVSRYAIVGIMTYIIFNILIYVFNIYFISTISSSFAYVLAVLFNFIASRFFTFKAYGQNVFNQLKIFFLLSVFNYGVVFFSNLYFVETCGLNIYIVNNIAVIFTIVIGFVVNNYVIFKKKYRTVK
jgi:putative flippase GtrA